MVVGDFVSPIQILILVFVFTGLFFSKDSNSKEAGPNPREIIKVSVSGASIMSEPYHSKVQKIVMTDSQGHLCDGTIPAYHWCIWNVSAKDSLGVSGSVVSSEPIPNLKYQWSCKPTGKQVESDKIIIEKVPSGLDCLFTVSQKSEGYCEDIRYEGVLKNYNPAMSCSEKQIGSTAVCQKRYGVQEAMVCCFASIKGQGVPLWMSKALCESGRALECSSLAGQKCAVEDQKLACGNNFKRSNLCCKANPKGKLIWQLCEPTKLPTKE